MPPGPDSAVSAPGTAATSGLTVVRAAGVRRSYGGPSVLEHVDLEISPGEFVALIGRSGSGKSTLLRALAGLDRAIGGELAVSGTVTMAFQDARLVPWKRVIENVSLGLRAPDPDAVAGAGLEEVGLGGHLRAWPLTLSGGEAQRVSLARALVREPELLLLDEPFGALDALTRISMHNLVLDLWERHRPAVLLVTHDVDEALVLADRVLVLADGVVAHIERISLERPREREDPELINQRNRLLAELGVDTKGTVL
jgi:sulfonate transport system ATP-binding protein